MSHKGDPQRRTAATIVTLLRKLSTFPHPADVDDVWPALKSGEKALLLVASTTVPLAVTTLVIGTAVMAFVPAIRHPVLLVMEATWFLLMLILAAGLFLVVTRARSRAATGGGQQQEAMGVERQVALATGSRNVQIVLGLGVVALVLGVVTQGIPPYSLVGLFPVVVFWILWRMAPKIPSARRPIQIGLNEAKLKVIVLILFVVGALLSAIATLTVLLNDVGRR